MRRRSRSRGGLASTKSRWFLVGTLVLGAVTLAFPSGAYTAIDGGRPAEIALAPGEAGLLGVDLADSITIGSDPPSCAVTNDTVFVSSWGAGSVTTPHGVVVTSGASVDGDVDAGGCVVVRSGARVTGDVDAAGEVTVHSGSRIDGAVDAGSHVTLRSGSRIGGAVAADGDVTVHSGSRIDGNAVSGGAVVLHSGSRIGGDVQAQDGVELHSGSRIGGDVHAGGTVVLHPGSRIGGDVHVASAGDVQQSPGSHIGGNIVTDGGGGGGAAEQFLATVTNNLGETVQVTVSLTDPADGTLSAPGGSGTTVQFTLAPGGSATVDITPTAAGGSLVELSIAAASLDGGTSVELSRTVPKVTS